LSILFNRQEKFKRRLVNVKVSQSLKQIAVLLPKSSLA
jgi:hypothetical protein